MRAWQDHQARLLLRFVRGSAFREEDDEVVWVHPVPPVALISGVLPLFGRTLLFGLDPGGSGFSFGDSLLIFRFAPRLLGFLPGNILCRRFVGLRCEPQGRAAP